MTSNTLKHQSTISRKNSKISVLLLLLQSCMERNWYLRNWVTHFFWHFFDIFEAREGLGGLKLPQIDAANSFPMLPRPRRQLKWPVMSPFGHIFPYFSHDFPVSFHISQYCYYCTSQKAALGEKHSCRERRSDSGSASSTKPTKHPESAAGAA